MGHAPTVAVGDPKAQPQPNRPTSALLRTGVLPDAAQVGEANRIAHGSGAGPSVSSPTRTGSSARTPGGAPVPLTAEERRGLHVLVDRAMRQKIGSHGRMELKLRKVDRLLEDIYRRDTEAIEAVLPDNDSNRVWDRISIAEAIRDWHALYGKPPRLVDWKLGRHSTDGSWPSWSTVVAHFGTFNQGVSSAGIEPEPGWRGLDGRRNVVDGDGILRCSKCNKEKPDDSFSRNVGLPTRRYRRHWCRDCDNARRNSYARREK